MPDKFLFLVDDAWRFEKLDLLRYLRGKLDFDVATHDALTEDMLKPYMPVQRVPIEPLRRGLWYSLVYFFARELDTHICRMTEFFRYRSRPWYMRGLMHLRRLAGKLGLRRYEWVGALRRMYRGSNRHTELLGRYRMLLYSPVSTQDKRILFEAQALGLDMVCWVFSWDNPYKDTEFLPDADCFLVWNDQNRNDLERIFGIPPERCEIVGPVQFDYLHRERTPQPPPRPYILFACTMGLDFYVQQEMALIRLLREHMDRHLPDVELVVRPYPFRSEENLYAPLRDIQGVRLLSYGKRFVKRRALMDREDEEAKFHQMNEALATVTLGSTIALEAALTRAPVVQIIFNPPNKLPRLLDLSEVWKNEHLVYVLDYDLPNIVRDQAGLDEVLGLLASGDNSPLMAYSQHLRAFADPLGLDNYRDVFYRAVAERVHKDGPAPYTL